MRFNSSRIFSAFIGLALLAGTAATPVLAQTNSPNTEHHQHDAWETKLNLTADQQAQIKQIHEAEKAEVQGVFTADQINQLKAPRTAGEKRPNLNLRDDQKQQLRQIREKYEAQIQAVLTPDQQQQLQTLKAQHAGSHHKDAGDSNQ